MDALHLALSGSLVWPLLHVCRRGIIAEGPALPFVAPTGTGLATVDACKEAAMSTEKQIIVYVQPG